MATIWVLAADSARAKILVGNDRIGPLVEVETFEHPEAQLREQDLQSDRPGRGFDSAGTGVHAMSKAVDPKEHEAERFAKSLSERLEKGRMAKAFDCLALIAPPRFLGLLRDTLTPETRDLVSLSIDKHFVDLDPSDLRTKLLPYRC